MPVRTDPYELYQIGHYAEALRCLREAMADRELVTGDKILLSELMWLRGELEGARSLATSLLERRDLTAKQKCGIHYVLAHVHTTKGDNNRAAEHFRTGAELAAQSGDLREECRLRVQWFLHQLHCFGPHRTGTDLDALRRKVLRAADPATSALFYVGLTELAARLALLPRARKHFETARALVSAITNRAIYNKLRHAEFALCLEEGYVSVALEIALALVQDEDVSYLKAQLPVSVAHLCILAARFDNAEMLLQRALRLVTPGGGPEIALHDTFTMLRLAQGRLEEAAEWDRSVRQLTDTGQFHDSYFALWALLARVQLLYRRGQVHDGLSVALESIPRVARMSHRNLLARMKLLAAEGYGLIGQTLDGTTLVEEVFESDCEQSVEILAETLRVAGGLVSSETPNVASNYYHHAEEILRLLGNVTGAAAVSTDRQQRVLIVNTQPIDARKDAIAIWSERVATLLSVGSHPSILGTQAKALIDDSQTTDSTRLIEFPEGRTPPPLPDGGTRIALGTHRQRQFELHTTPKRCPADRATLLAIHRIVQKSRELATAQLKERERVAPWLTTPAEPQLGLICASERMLDIIKTIRRVALSNATVLITGETGVGKELFARALHLASTRADQVFLPFNCSTVPRDLIDSQLFGHKRGAFTGAHDDSSGMIRSAAGGTLLLDEIGEMTLDAQPKLLRFLESGEIVPIGESKPQLVDVRIVAATNANLDQLVADGRFREDLYYRLNVIRIDVPPLRERREEIPTLVEHFLEQFSRELDKPMLRIADETLEYLVLYGWPGNVRQLANEVRRLVAMAEPGSIIMPAHLADNIAESRRTLPVNRSPRLFNEIVTRIDQPLSAALEHVERAAIQRALSMTDGRLDEAAKMLGLSRKGLYLKRQRLNLG